MSKGPAYTGSLPFLIQIICVGSCDEYILKKVQFLDGYKTAYLLKTKFGALVLMDFRVTHLSKVI